MLAYKAGFIEGIRLGRSVAIGGAGVAPAGLSSTQKVFGQTSYYNNGTLNNKITVTPLTGLAFGTTNFTLELRCYPVGAAVYTLIDFRPLNTSGPYPNIRWATDRFIYNTNAVDRLQTTALALNTWYAVAVVRNGTTTTMYLDGTSVGSWVDTTNYLAALLSLASNGYAANGSPSLNGYLDEVRISNIARYTANYTPATAPFIDDDNTLVLCHFDGAVGSRTFVDDNT